MKRTTVAALALFLFAAGLLRGQEAPSAAPADFEALMARYRPSCVTLNYHLVFSGSEEPFGRGFRCPNCNAFHRTDLAEHVTHQYPLRVPGYLVGEREVVSANLHIPARFIARVTATFAGATTNATCAGWALDEDAVRFALAGPLPGTKPLTFAAGGAPRRQIAFSFEDGMTQMNVAPLGPDSFWCEELACAFRKGMPSALALDAESRAVGLSIPNVLPLGASFVPPAQWKWLDDDAMRSTLARIEARVAAGLFPVRLNFRVEKHEEGSRYRRRGRMMGGEEGEETPERHAVGLLIAPDRLAIIAALSVEQVATLTGLTATTPQGEIVGTFVGQFRDYGILMASFPGIGGQPLAFDEGAPAANFRRLAIGVAPRAANNRLFLRFGTSRIERFDEGYLGMMQPEFPLPMSEALLVDLEGRLLALHCALTAPMAAEQNADDLILSSRMAAALFAHPEAQFQSGAAPRPDGRPAPPPWFGAELQAMTEEMALLRHLDMPDGEPYGARVSAVESNSPAAAAGLLKDDLIIQWGLAADNLVPLEFEDQDGGYGGAFPWQRLDELPEEYYEQLPAPWPAVRNSFIDRLERIGAGGSIHLAWLRGDQRMSARLAIAPGQPTYETVPRRRHRDIGLTLKDLTPEVRRYLQLDADAPGLVVAGVTPGGRAAVAGVKPFELITRVNDQPVPSNEAFDALLKASPDELRLTVSRIGKDRIVKLRKPAGDAVETEADAGGDVGEDEAGDAPAADAPTAND